MANGKDLRFNNWLSTYRCSRWEKKNKN